MYSLTECLYKRKRKVENTDDFVPMFQTCEDWDSCHKSFVLQRRFYGCELW